ncbi:hypothetical protein AB1Y20_018741 [Prymnesium parvum]|uniref:Uncharacterized protein n=1 Tax=Prymnesium parvum TaxID=97485 RepID=A0AB34JPZ8_PRYPA
MGANVSACLGEQQPTRKPVALPATQSVARAVSTHPALQKDASRPKYFSDGDTRPVYRGAMYAFIRRSGLAWAVLCTYGMFAVWDATALQSAHFWRWDLLACRLLHVIALYFNVVLSDDLHNLDQRLGTVYDAPSTLKIEQQLHAQDWRAALAVPASYHVLLLFGIMEPSRTEMSDWLLLGVHLASCVLMCIRISPRRITPRRELFLSFVLTFVVQMVLLLVVFWRERAHHPWWLPVWAMYGSGLIAKGLERPDSETFGHHEVMHATTIIGHIAGIAVDVLTS